MPSGETAIASVVLSKRAMTPSSRPEAVSQCRMVPSWPAVKIVPSAGEMARLRIAERWPDCGKTSRPVATSQRRIIGSGPVEASVRPSGEKQSDLTHPWCAGKWRSSLARATSQR